MLGMLLVLSVTHTISQDIKSSILALAESKEDLIIEWRHHFHQYPELSNREFKTSKKIAEILNEMGLEVQTGIAYTGVVGVLKGGKPGPVVALRADIDGLPITETSNLPYKSMEKTNYAGQEVGVMHACGHDTHISILLGVAKVLSEVKNDIPGTVKFIFQPAEEGPPEGEEGGAGLMIKEGVMKNPDVQAIFGLHTWSEIPSGVIKYKPGGTMASSNEFFIKVHGAQTHGGRPWGGTDPIVTASQIVNNLQTIVSRNLELTNEPAVISIGTIHGGVRSNIIPNYVEMSGTIRTFDEEMRQTIFKRMKEIVEHTGASNGGSAEITIHPGNPVTFNDVELTKAMLPTLEEVAGKENVILTKGVTPAEDFSKYQQVVPGLFLHLGGLATGKDPSKAPAHHTPEFTTSDEGMLLGVKALSRLAVDYLLEHQN